MRCIGDILIFFCAQQKNVGMHGMWYVDPGQECELWNVRALYRNLTSGAVYCKTNICGICCIYEDVTICYNIWYPQQLQIGRKYLEKMCILGLYVLYMYIYGNLETLNLRTV